MYFIIGLIFFVVSLVYMYKAEIIDEDSDSIEAVMLLLLAFILSLGWFITLPIVIVAGLLYLIHKILLWIIKRV